MPVFLSLKREKESQTNFNFYKYRLERRLRCEAESPFLEKPLLIYLNCYFCVVFKRILL